MTCSVCTEPEAQGVWGMRVSSRRIGADNKLMIPVLPEATVSTLCHVPGAPDTTQM